MKGTSAESKAINSYLDTLKAKVYEHQQEILREGKTVNSENMRNKIYGIEKRSHMLVSIFQMHNDEVKALIGKDFAIGTYKRYVTSLKHIIFFMQWKYKVSDIDIHQIDHEFISSYEFYLKSQCECEHNAAMKHIPSLQKSPPPYPAWLARYFCRLPRRPLCCCFSSSRFSRKEAKRRFIPTATAISLAPKKKQPEAKLHNM